MKYAPIYPFAAAVAVAVGFASLSSPVLGTTPDAYFAGIFKEQDYLQSGAAAPLIQNNYVFGLHVIATSPDSVNAWSFTGPGTGTSSSSISADWGYEAYYTTQAAMDLAYANGTYSLGIQTANNGSVNTKLSLTGDIYPSAPHISNYPTLTATNAYSGFTVSWDAISGGTTSDWVDFQILSTDGKTQLYNSPSYGQPGALNGASTSYVIPAGVLAQGSAFAVDVTIFHLVTVDNTTYPGVPLWAGYAANTSLQFGNTFIWSASAGSGTWSNGSNWSGGNSPNGAGDAISFDGTGTLATCNIDQTYTVGSILFSGSVAYTLSGNSLLMDNTGGAGHAVINSWSTVTQTVNSVVVTTAASDLDIVSSGGSALLLPNGIDNTTGKTVTFNATNNSTISAGAIINNGAVVIAGSHSLVSLGAISGTGSLSVQGGKLDLAWASTFAGGTTVTGGKLLVNNSSGSATGSGSVTINGGLLGGYGMIAGTVIAGPGAHTIQPSYGLTANSAGTLTVGSLTANSNTTLAFNLVTPGASGTNDVIRVSTANGLILNGGTVQIANTSTGAASLGYYKIIQYSGSIGGAGISGLTLPMIAANVAYTLDITHDPGFIDLHRGLIGDANDDGVVNFADFITLSNNFGQANKGWGGGDFNNDGITNFSDFITLSNNFGHTIGANEVAALDAVPALGVPEPASLVLLGGGLLGVSGRWRRRSSGCRHPR